MSRERKTPNPRVEGCLAKRKSCRKVYLRITLSKEKRTMTGVDERIAEAKTRFDKNDFAGAIEDYRAAAIQMPTKIDLVLGNLSVAETQERLAFAREMSGLYPDSIIVRSISQ